MIKSKYKEKKKKITPLATHTSSDYPFRASLPSKARSHLRAAKAASEAAVSRDSPDPPPVSRHEGSPVWGAKGDGAPVTAGV